MPDLPQSLIDALRAGTLIPFVGAGVSVGAVHHLPPEHRFPDWKGLIEALADRLEAEGNAPSAAQVRLTLATDTMAAAEQAVQALGRMPFLETMEGLFDRPRPRGAELSLVHAIWRLRPPFVVTTNYDRVLEWPFPTGAVRPVHNDDPSYINDIGQPSDRRRIWYLHGSIRRIDTIILTAGQYTSLYPSPDNPSRLLYENAAQRFEDLLKTHAFLFIGYSLDEPLLRERLEQVRGVAGQAVRMKFLLLRQGQADAAMQLELRDTYGVQVVEFSGFGPPLIDAVDAMSRTAWPHAFHTAATGLTPLMAPLVDALHEACAGIILGATDVARLFNAARPAGWEAAVPGTDQLQQLSAAITTLGGACTPASGAHPLLIFADRLKDEISEPQRGRVSDWLSFAVDAIADDPAEAMRMRQALAAARAEAAARPAHVLVRIAPATAPVEGWRVHAWAFTGSDPEVLFGAAGIDIDPGDEGELVAALVEAMQTRDFDAATTTIAFLVPCALATAPLDQWQLPRDIADDPPLGATHLVTVRSLERLGKHRIVRQRLKKAWTEVMARATEVLRIVDPVAPAPNGSLRGQWIDLATACSGSLAAALEAKSVRCVLLMDAPTSDAIAHLTAVLDTPTPVVLWCRDASIPFDELAVAVRDLVESGTLAGLPERVRERRRQAVAPDGPPLGRHLALLWDNADYVPPDTATGARAGILTT